MTFQIVYQLQLLRFHSNSVQPFTSLDIVCIFSILKSLLNSTRITNRLPLGEGASRVRQTGIRVFIHTQQKRSKTKLDLM